MKLTNKILGLAAAGAVAFSVTESVEAVPTIQIKVDGMLVKTIVDGDMSDLSATAGRVDFDYIDTFFSLAGTTLRTKPLTGSASAPILSAGLEWNRTALAGEKTLEVFFSESGFGPSLDSGVGIQTSASFNQSSGTSGYIGSAFYDSADGVGMAGAVSTLASTGSIFLNAAQSADPNLADSVVPAGLASYSLTAYLKITSASENDGGDSDITLIGARLPDGGSTVAFLGMALVAVEGVRRKFAKA